MLETLVDEFRLLPAYLAEIELDGWTGRSMAGAPVNDILDYGGHEGADSSW